MNDHRFLAVCHNGLYRADRDSIGTWRITHLIPDAAVTCLASDSLHPRTILAGSRNGVFRSEDGGIGGTASGMAGLTVKSLAVSPLDSNVVYAGTKPTHLYHSDDGGRTWVELEGFRKIPNRWWWFSPAEPPDFRPYVMSIAPSPTERDVLLAGIEFGAVIRSTDGGKTWARHRLGALRDCHSLKFHATDGQRLYQAGGTGGGVAFSEDGGVTFHKETCGLAAPYGIVCAADPANPDIWYVCVAPTPFKAFGDHPTAYLYRSVKGKAWEPIGWEPHPLSATPTTLVTMAEMPGCLVAGLANGEIYHSTDYGTTWQRLPFTFPRIWFGLLVLPAEVVLNQ